MTRTKIICTIGPSVNTPEKIEKLIEAGMDAARLNFSHGTHEEHELVINYIKEIRQRLKKPVAIILDTKGPEIRLGKMKNGQVELKAGQRWFLTKESVEGDQQQASITPAFILEQLAGGEKMLFDDGYITSRVVQVESKGVYVEILNSGIIRSNKGVNIPDVSLNLPAMTERDIADIRFGCRQDVDIIAASFVRSAEHVLEIKKLLKDENHPEILVLAKIENAEGVHHFDSIVQVADGIMIARGDLGVELPLSQVPVLQKMMIRKCYLAGKPSVTATQMLESMINNPRPTRAEASDVANAIYDSTSAVMLSGETAVGKYPMEAVEMMKGIIRSAEADFDYKAFFENHLNVVYHDVPAAVSLASVNAAYSSNAKAIFTFTSGGSTARLLSRLRPGMPIIALTPNQKSYYQLACNWGVIPLHCSEGSHFSEAFHEASTFALNQELVSYGDLVVVTAGNPFGISGTTNMMVLENIGDVLVRGLSGFGRRVHGNVAIVLSPEGEKLYRFRNKLVVITKCDDSYSPIIQEAAGVILQNHVDDQTSEKIAMEMATTMGKPIIVRADSACRVLRDGQLVTIDPEKALVYNRIFP